MKANFDTRDEHFWRNMSTHIVLIIATVAIIGFLLPKEKDAQYNYVVGKPWMYSSLIAKFDFPIYKDESVIKQEQDSIMTMYEPYFDYDSTVATNNINKFMENFSNGIEGLPKSFIYTIAERLKYIYDQGIIDTHTYSQMSTDTTQNIIIIKGRQGISMPLKSVNSVMSAYELLLSHEAINAQRPLLQKYNLSTYIKQNLFYDEEKSEDFMRELKNSVPIASGIVMSGQKIIDRGDIITDQDYRIIESYIKEMKKRTEDSSDYWYTTFGQMLFIFILLVLFTFYLLLFREEYIRTPRSILTIYALIIAFEVIVALTIQHTSLTAFIIPFAIVPIFVRVFMDSRTAFIVHIILILICSLAIREQFEFIAVETVAGLAAIYSLRDLSKRSQLFNTSIIVTVASMATYFALELMKGGVTSYHNTHVYVNLCINGVLLLFAYPLMYVIERLSGVTSNVTLIELSNINNALLKRMSEIAAGTFQHSFQVSNLCAEVANKIGANGQLVRTGALYHDIGKMSKPAYFTENQGSDSQSPHSRLSEKESAKIIIGHIEEGLRLADKYNLPQVIKDFIRTHHGKSIANYFYITYKNNHPDEEVDIRDFQYAGPNPFTKEQAILMMCDSVEAASRSLKEYTEDNIRDLVENIINKQVEAGYFEDCPVTFRDIKTTKKVLVDKLLTLYHSRISYPTLNKDAGEKSETGKV